MHQNLEIPKLTALRLKTDRQLAVFIHNRLDSAAEFARLEDRVSRERARLICDEVHDLLPFATILGQERRRIEAKLARLSERLGIVELARPMSMCG